MDVLQLVCRVSRKLHNLVEFVELILFILFILGDKTTKLCDLATRFDWVDFDDDKECNCLPPCSSITYKISKTNSKYHLNVVRSKMYQSGTMDAEK